VQTHVRSTIDPELKPLHNVCEYLNAVHIYADEARQGIVRTVDAHHFCSHVSKGIASAPVFPLTTPSFPPAFYPTSTIALSSPFVTLTLTPLFHQQTSDSA
jgi:hypothetical protein